MSGFVLDASALIAMLRGERGATKVAAEIASASMSVVNYAEVVSHFIHAGMPGQDVDAMLDPLPIQLVPVDHELARTAGKLRALTASPGLSVGDRFCLALAKRDDLSAWTADKVWKQVASDIGVKVTVIR